MTRPLKLHGAFRSGTNYVKALLELNYDVELFTNKGGWKHAPVCLDPDRPWPVIGVVKHPYAWLDSMWRYMADVGGAHVTGGSSWRSFLREPLLITHGQRADVPTYRFADPCDYWNAMASNFLSLGDSGTVVRYEDALNDPVEFCDRIAGALHLPRRQGEFQRVTTRTRNMVDRRRSSIHDYTTGRPFDASWYRSETYLRSFSWIDRRNVRRRLDTGLLRTLEYI